MMQKQARITYVGNHSLVRVPKVQSRSIHRLGLKSRKVAYRSQASRSLKTNFEATVGDRTLDVVSTEQSFVKSFLSNQKIVEGDVEKQLEISERYWKGMKRNNKNSKAKPPTVVQRIQSNAPKKEKGSQANIDFDVCVCGGNLGIAIALALQNRGHRVLIVERRLLKGRTQEWNASRKEMRAFLKTGLLTEEEIEKTIVSEFNPNRVSFKGGEDVWVNNILNIGVAPDKLIGMLKRKFLAKGGVIRELCEFKSANVYDDMAVLKLRNLHKREKIFEEKEVVLDMIDANKPNAIPTLSSIDEEEDSILLDQPEKVTCSLLIDCMGHFSPVVKQVRGGSKPQGIVFVVGGCISEGFPNLKHSDILSSFSDAEQDMQYFWEAFPARDGNTIYMFTYIDADESRSSFEEVLEYYIKALPEYAREGLKAEAKHDGTDFDPNSISDDMIQSVQFKRLLMAAFPSYKKAPLNAPFDRVLFVGDSSSVQSPLSFGGFGAMLRHLSRLDEAVDEALKGGHLNTKDLSFIQPYMPSLSAAWLFQRSMGFSPGQMGHSGNWPQLPEDMQWTKTHINQVLKTNFSAMKNMDDSILLSFLQDTIQFVPLTLTMFGMLFYDPVAIFRVVGLLGFGTLSEWFVHYTLMGIYTTLDFLFGRFRPNIDNFYARRIMDAWHYGSGMDYEEV